ncbi:MAG: XdhC family protein [Anaerolineales bacterium]|nr:XdhC family protein [Anaerolineales bacterium]MCX7756472.1 XdhC family protein [Anaerolineales bacterium]MDW8278345.1 XdhC family protein [Anaerolineales bacterium]
MNENLYRLISEALERGESTALCTITEAHGSTPRHTGSKMLVFEDGRFIGTIGGGELERRVLDEARKVIQAGKPVKLHYAMSDPARGDPGVCGGQVEVFVEPILPKETIVVIGGGHVGKAVAHLAKWLGFWVVVSDDRAEFCTPEMNPDADVFLHVPMAELPRHLNINRNTYLLLTTRGSAVDVAGLPALLETPARYIGVIGSKRRWATTVKALKERGISEQALARVHSPMGLELNAETPEEIAVSMMAEILLLKHGGDGKPMSK